MTLPDDDGQFGKAFERSYKSEFGFLLKDKDIVVDDVRCIYLRKVGSVWLP